MDLKTVDHVYTTLALIDRQGLLSIYEPAAPDDFKDWTLIDVFNVCGSANPPGRGDETSFKVRWDPNPTPLAYVNSVSDDRTQLSLVVSVLNEVKIYRSVVPTTESLSSDGASHRLMFYEAVKIPRHPALVRDVQWAPFSVRGTDRIATACKDGAVRIFELAVSEAPATDNTNNNNNTNTTTGRNTSQLGPHTSQHQQQQSSLTSGLTGRAPNTNTPTTTTTPAPGPPSRAARTGHAFPFITTVQSTSSLPHAHADAWSLSFDGQGQVLLSNGSDGVTKIWRKSVLGGQWLVFAGQEVLDAGDDTDGDDMDDDQGGDSD